VDGVTGLHHATSNSHPKVIKLLLDHKANVCAEDEFKHTPCSAQRAYTTPQSPLSY